MPSTVLLKLPTLLLIAFAVGCSSGGGVIPVSGGGGFVARQAEAALAAQERGDLALARSIWLTVQTYDPAYEPAKDRLLELEQQIQVSVDKNLEQAKQAYARGNRRSGDRALLNVLALQPANAQAMASLRASVSEASHAKQAEKVREEQNMLAMADQQRRAEERFVELNQAYREGDFEQVLSLGQSDELKSSSTAQSIVVSALQQLAHQASAQGDFELELGYLEQAQSIDSSNSDLSNKVGALKQRISSEALKEGIALMKSDLNGAVEKLQLALSYDPSNVAIKRRLRQASTLQKNLEKIRGQ
ncbi:MAG: hypothetical protein AAF098_07970 [Pseudomonadota bacterium]